MKRLVFFSLTKNDFFHASVKVYGFLLFYVLGNVNFCWICFISDIIIVCILVLCISLLRHQLQPLVNRIKWVKKMNGWRISFMKS